MAEAGHHRFRPSPPVPSHGFLHQKQGEELGGSSSGIEAGGECWARRFQQHGERGGDQKLANQQQTLHQPRKSQTKDFKPTKINTKEAYESW